MAQVIYTCPSCKKWVKMRGVYRAETLRHECRLCGSVNSVRVTITQIEQVGYRATATKAASD